jgi:thioredoxin reductase
VFPQSGELSHTCSTHWVCWRIWVIVVGSGPLALWAVQELTEGGLKVVLFEVGTRRSPMTFLPTQRSAELFWGASNRRFSVGRLRRHADPAGASLAENLEVNR